MPNERMKFNLKGYKGLAGYSAKINAKLIIIRMAFSDNDNVINSTCSEVYQIGLHRRSENNHHHANTIIGVL
jgi:hypothetical protein